MQVECKKAQPKEVMLPANLAKTRAAGRGTYGEFVVLSNPHGPSSSLGAIGSTAATALRFTPYPLPNPMATHHHHHHAVAAAAAGSSSSTAHLVPVSPGSSIFQLAPGSALLETLPAHVGHTYKRVYATSAAAAALRSHSNSHHDTGRTTTTLTYPLGDLLQVQGLDIPALYSLPTATIGL